MPINVFLQFLCKFIKAVANYGRAVERLQQLFEEGATDDEFVDEEDPDEIDNVSTRTDSSDTEEEIDDSASSVILDPDVPYFLGKDGTKWAKHRSARTTKTP
ncbi:hypothetical protein JTB14_019614 [Gonioctena quinquepunctata]|nr:hypothetical protein JTB14_019614 [Gonioctena quinquepunctata]